MALTAYIFSALVATAAPAGLGTAVRELLGYPGAAMNSRRYQGYDSKVSLTRILTCREDLESRIFANVFIVCVRM